jgi:hypothetical protein
MKTKKNINRRGRGRPTCCAKLIENIVKYASQDGKIHKLPLKRSSLAEAKRVMRQAEPDFNWIIA